MGNRRAARAAWRCLAAESSECSLLRQYADIDGYPKTRYRRRSSTSAKSASRSAVASMSGGEVMIHTAVKSLTAQMGTRIALHFELLDGGGRRGRRMSHEKFYRACFQRSYGSRVRTQWDGTRILLPERIRELNQDPARARANAESHPRDGRNRERKRVKRMRAKHARAAAISAPRGAWRRRSPTPCCSGSAGRS
jgi:hypothetical protein